MSDSPKIEKYTLFNFNLSINVEKLTNEQIEQLRKLSLVVADTIERVTKVGYNK
jgi:hypothetical protein